MFEVGDKVRRITKSFNGMKPGEVATIIKIKEIKKTKKGIQCQILVLDRQSKYKREPGHCSLFFELENPFITSIKRTLRRENVL